VLKPVKGQSKKTRKTDRLNRRATAGTNSTARSSGNVGKDNKNQRINRWHVDHMKGALEEYHNRWECISKTACMGMECSTFNVATTY